MNLAKFTLEISRRARLVGELPDERLQYSLQRLGMLAQEGTSDEAKSVREVLVALIHSDHENDCSAATLDALTPVTLRRLEAVLEGLLNGWYTTERLRAVLRPVLVKSVK